MLQLTNSLGEPLSPWSQHCTGHRTAQSVTSYRALVSSLWGEEGEGGVGGERGGEGRGKEKEGEGEGKEERRGGEGRGKEDWVREKGGGGM